MGQIKNKALLRKIAQKIKALREQRGITQEAFYHDTSIHIERIETAQANITVSTLDAICKYFKISLKEFFEEI